MSQKSVSFFLCLKYAAFSLIAGKTCFGLFSVKLGCFQQYCTGKMFSASLQRVTLILFDFTQNNVSVYFRVTLFSVLCLQEQPFPFFSYLNCAFKET